MAKRFDRSSDGGFGAAVSSVNANETLLNPSVAGTTGGSATGSFVAASRELTPPAQPAATSRDQLAIPLGDMLGMASQRLLGGITDPFKRGFVTPDVLQSRIANTTQQGIGDFLEMTGLDISELTGGQIDQLTGRATELETEGARQQNAEAFGATVGLTAATEGLRAATAIHSMRSALESEMKNMQRSHERALNSIEFNRKMEKTAMNIAEMRNRLRIIDSVMTQGEFNASGQQRQTFFRDPLSGNRI